ncbi:trans-aconitate 2-methyltransferase [Arboricoccus pini]|uniref:Trans-aconitate 2-methyltransferase n=1 Tax=Arboricoccus pini TaxID=1963835 RepID=A0A212RNK7_9PROT|nr:trans-aconitate 2-methyltransferase [Arboricoccus pini]SNB74150.1 trans-aconitate 2-methyltransferase [Arboricoccus pini]
MADWNPELYARFERERTRPAQDLLAAVPLDDAAFVVDLGCGPGNSTELLQNRYPTATILGVDSSPAMLEKAARRLPGASFERADMLTWETSRPVSLIFANASLQWVPGHEALLPRLLSMLAPGGVLAFQVPDNRDEPTHRLMRETADEPRFAARIGEEAHARLQILRPDDYYDLMAPRAEAVDVWRTIYHHQMADASAIVDWVSATGLRPYLEPLDDDGRAAFRQAYQQRIDKAYPSRTDGRRLMPFPRLFAVASI